MILVNIFLVLLFILVLSDLYINNFPKSKLVLVPVNYKIKKKDGLNELIIDFKISNKSKTKETMVTDINFELDFFKSKGNKFCQNLNYQEDIYIYEKNKEKSDRPNEPNYYWNGLIPQTIIINSDGEVKYDQNGIINIDELNKVIGELKGIDLNETEFSVESFNEYNSIISQKKDKNKT